MQPLIRIESIPIEYEMKSNSAKLEMKATQIPPITGTMQLENVRLDLRAKNIQVQLDSSQMRHDLGFRTTADMARENAQKGMEHIQELTRNYVETGKQLSNIHEGVDISQIVKQKTLEQPSTPYTVFLPNGGTEISWIPNDLTIHYNPPQFDVEYQMSKYQFEYTPASIDFTITQYPEVRIEYLGTPSYVPPSADPNYDGGSNE
ncbi:MAG: hypothetical protein HFJ84_03355 [Clostridiales bacterium]|jgi:hypothetical protein|nr:hypothetical protein [Clostridiales bacterium]